MEPPEYEALDRLEGTHWWFQGMKALSQAAVARRMTLGPQRRILDVGCGTGGNLLWLGACGQAIGVDFAPLAVSRAKRKAPRVGLAVASVSTLPFPAGAFQLATCFDVLYHSGIADDRAALRELWRVLSPEGWLLVRVPAHDWLRRGHDERVHTARRYSAVELREKLEGAGFRIVHLTPVGVWLLPGAVVGNFGFWISDFGSSKRDSVTQESLYREHGRSASQLRLPLSSINWLLGKLLAVEGRWAARHRLPWGLSLFAVARKPVKQGASCESHLASLTIRNASIKDSPETKHLQPAPNG